jgi:hypothetical protein
MKLQLLDPPRSLPLLLPPLLVLSRLLRVDFRGACAASSDAPFFLLKHLLLLLLLLQLLLLLLR